MRVFLLILALSTISSVFALEKGLCIVSRPHCTEFSVCGVYNSE